MSGRSWLILAGLYAFGGLLGHGAGPHLVMAITAALLLSVLVVLSLRAQVRRWRVVRVAALAAGVLSGSAAAAWWVEAPPRPARGAVGVVQAVRFVGDRIQMDVAPEGSPAHRVRVARAGWDAAMSPGALVRMAGPFQTPGPLEHPAGFDARAHLALDRVRWQSRGPVGLVQPAPEWRRWLPLIRQAARQRLDEIGGAPTGAAVLKGLLLGDRRAVPEAAREALQASGLAHLMAVSGLHVGGLAAVVAWLVVGVARRLGSDTPGRWAAAGAVPAALAMAAMAQWPLSACRAALMVSLWMGARSLGRRSSGPAMLAVALIMALAPDPAVAQGPALQLSFGAVGALLLMPRTSSPWVAAALTALVAALATAPVQAWHFGTATPIAPMANLVLVVPTACVLVPLGALGLALAPWTEVPLSLAAHGAEWLVACAEALAQLGGGAWWVGREAAWGLAAPVVMLLGWRLQQGRWGLVGAIALLIVWLWPGPSVVVEAIAVGQGDALVVRSGGSAALIDAGPDRQARALLHHLKISGIDHLSVVVLTHGHPDHFGGLLAVLEAPQIRIDRVLGNGRWLTGPEGQRLTRALDRRGLVMERPSTAMPNTAMPSTAPILIGEARLQVLAGGGPRWWSENDASVVVRVEGPGGSMLLTGDAEAEGEARLVRQGIEPVDVLKAGHHGSRTSTGEALLAAACPRAVLYTTGRDNRYGFPHQEVKARVAQRGLPTRTVGEEGLVRVDLSGPVRWWSMARPEWTTPPRAGPCAPALGPPAPRRSPPAAGPAG